MIAETTTSQSIKDFPKQFEFQPVVQNKSKLKVANKFVVAGMGGSHLGADLIKAWNPSLNIIVHEDYGLPFLPEDDLSEYLFIASSYSGNTEEVVDALNTAMNRGISVAIISVGGKLIEIAKEKEIPYAQIPDTGIQPRLALGFSVVGLLSLVGKDDELENLKKLSQTLDCAMHEGEGVNLAKKLEGYIPVIYSSVANKAIAYNWKIIFNETGKIPAFYNSFPELNHNEMAGFDVINTTKQLSEKFKFIFLEEAKVRAYLIVLEFF